MAFLRSMTSVYDLIMGLPGSQASVYPHALLNAMGPAHHGLTQQALALMFLLGNEGINE